MKKKKTQTKNKDKKTLKNLKRTNVVNFGGDHNVTEQPWKLQKPKHGKDHTQTCFKEAEDSSVLRLRKR